MAAPKKSLEALIRDQSFLARRHQQLLVDAPLVSDPGLRSLQQRYRDQESELERRQLALHFEKAVRNPLLRAHHAETLELDIDDEDPEEDPPSGLRSLQERYPQTDKEFLAELQRILDMPPAVWDPAKNQYSVRLGQAHFARDLRRDGLKLAAIAERLGVSRATVSRFLAELGVVPVAPGARRKAVSRAHGRAGRSAGESSPARQR